MVLTTESGLGYVTNDSTTMSPNTDADIQSQSWKHIQDGFYLAGIIITPTVLIIGVFGNTMAILTVSSRSFADLTSRYILTALACSDTTLILMQPFNKMFVQELFGFDARASSPGGCKFFFWLFRTAKMTSSWLIVILCFERFVAVVFPLKAKIIINRTSILALIACDYAVIGTYNSFWTFSSIIQNGVCKPDVVFPDTKRKYRNFLLAGLSLYSFIPMLIMIIITPVIVTKLLQKKRKMQKNLRSETKQSSKEIRASIVLIVIVVAFIVLVLPVSMVFIFAAWQNVSAFDTNTMDFFIYREISQILELLNYSINFFLYIMCSETFRQRALYLLRRPFRTKNKVGPNTTASETVSSVAPFQTAAGGKSVGVTAERSLTRVWN